ncbi:MAG: Pyrrolo-quinoline quinone [uncultured bacterium]|nr:MAG: Pyrrolo-quinoline quinone [uncultured bacterium]
MLWTQNTSNSENVVIPETTEDTGLAASTMATNGIAVAAIFATGELIGLSPEGKVLWQNKLETPSNHYGHSSSLITCKDILFVQYDHNEGASIKAFNILTGKMLWENKREVETCWSSPILVSTDSGEQLILTAVPLIIGYEAETGKILWQMKDTLTGEIGSSAAYIEGLLYVANQFATAACIDVKQQKILWQYDDNLPDASSPVVQNNFLILPSGTGKVTCLNSANGEMFWEHKFENGFYSSPIVVTDKVYLMDKKGNMQIFKLGREFELIAESKINEACVTTPAFAGNKIFIRGNENLFCIENKSK